MTTLETHDGIAVLRMQHGKVNALDAELCTHLVERLGRLAGDAGCKAVVLTGQGAVFSAGVDLLRVLEGGPGYIEPFLDVLHELCRALFGFPKPFVAAINGHAIAGGCIVACAADRRIMARGEGRVGIPELRVGVPFPAAPVEIMRFAVPARHLQELIYGGATAPADVAVERGLVDEAADPGDLEPRALRAAGELAAMGGESFRLTKDQIRGPVLEQMEAGHRRTRAELARIWCSDATLAAIRDYVSRTFKRPG